MSTEGKDLFGVAADMEENVAAVRDYANILISLAEAMPDEWGNQVTRLGWLVLDQAKALEASQVVLSKGLNPNRDQLQG